MKKLNVSGMVKVVRAMAVKHSPEILTGIGVAGMLTTVGMAVRATPKALRLLEEEKEKKGEGLTKVETVKAAWKPYIPAAATGVMSVACLIGANAVNAKRNAVLATAYSLSEAAFTEYRDKVSETVGAKKEEEIRDKVAKARIEKDPVSNHEVVITGKGDTLCYDVVSGRYFKSDIEKIRRAENVLNRKLMDEMYVSLNEFYYELGLRCTEMGNELGWNVNDGLVDLHFSTQLSEDETPCLVVDYHIAPRYGYC
ncbi:MAG: hypothetical protein HFH39_04100 [Lachnospiraceae bacterium]|nr:hypothetical protein [Lachnospiraceae bacterium]